MKSRILLIAALAVLLPALAGADPERTPARAMTVKDVIELSHSDVGDEVIVNQIEASRVVFKLTVDDILDLKKAGVSDRVITYMINTGKNDGDAGENNDNGDDSGYGDRYRSSVDSDYRGYDDPNWNIYLSWGFGRYYDPWYYSYWPGYTYYYYPVTCLRSYWPYYPYYYHYYNTSYPHYGYNSRTYKDGRYISGRGGSRQAPVYRGDSGRRGERGTRSGREYKGDYGNRGSSRSSNPPSSSSGRSMKSPTNGGRGAQSPPPSSSGSGSTQPPPSSNEPGRTMKKS
jgi:hypothetical protein